MEAYREAEGERDRERERGAMKAMKASFWHFCESRFGLPILSFGVAATLVYLVNAK